MSGVFGLACSRHPGYDLPPVLAGMGMVMSHQPWHRVDRECDDTAPVAMGRIGIGGVNPGVQPATDPQKRVSLFMAGEFYYRERLVQTLDTEQRPSQEEDDASLALRLYLALGPEFVDAAEGMFSIAIWDRSTRHVVVLNDRFGLVPTYYNAHDGRLVFAPEIKAVLRAPGVSRRLDETALAEYVRYQQVLGEKTLFEGITLLPPASVLTFDTRTGALSRRTYWDGERLVPLNGSTDPRDIERETCRLVNRAVDARLSRARRPGLFLSGGLDSRTLLAVASHQGARLGALTFGHPESRDVRIASRVARAAGIEHHVHEMVDGTWVTDWADRHLELVEGAHSWMHAHGISALPAARDVMDVNLSGAAGVFGDLYNKPSVIHAPDDEALVQNLHRFYAQEHAWPGLTAEEERTLYTPAYSARLAGRAFESLRAEVAPYCRLDPRLRGLMFNLHNHSRRMNHYLVVFNSAFIENRCPYFDYELTDWMLRLPVERKAGKQQHVAVLRRAAPRLTHIPYDKDYRLPTAVRPLRLLHAVIDRAVVAMSHRLGRELHRQTLAVDYEHYLRHELRGWAEDLLLSDRSMARGIFRREAVRSLFDRHLAGREPWVVGKFNVLITVEMLMRRHFDA